MIYREWLHEWLESYVKPTSKPRTYERYRSATAMLIRQIGDIELAALSPSHLQRCTANLIQTPKPSGEQYSLSSVNLAMSVMLSSLKAADAVGHYKSFGFAFLRRPKLHKSEASCFSRQEQLKMEQFIEANLCPRYMGYMLCLYTGLRLGEVLSLEWSDVNFRSRLISVNKTCYYKSIGGKRTRTLLLPKSPSSVRVIPLPRRIVHLLQLVRAKYPSKYVVSNGKSPIEPRSYQRSFKLFLRYVNVPERTFHSLRHTFATRALECGMDIKTISDIMGHSNSAITLDRYSHSLLDHKQREVLKLDGLFK